MPLRVNVGVSRKIGEPNYGSRGASVNVEMELDGSLVTEPEKLQDRIRRLFGLVRTSVTEELRGSRTPSRTAGGPNGRAAPESNGTASGGRENGEHVQESTIRKPRPATQSQVKAIYAIARAREINVTQLLQERFRASQPDDLNIRQASQLIEELKKSPEQEGGGG
jgi:hypothetical protein